ncbi:MAG: hypothetical protein ACUVXG_02975 [Anaerolineae bacterium]
MTPYQEPVIRSQVQPLDFKLLGVPGSYNPTPSHWSLWDLQRWHERIYVAHGDWLANTGPVRAIYLDLENGEFIHDEGFIMDEEAIEVFRVCDDTLYAPGADSTESWDLGTLYFKPWGGGWTKRRAIPSAVHLWDVALLDGTLIVAGRIAADDRGFGAVWASADGGMTWQPGPEFRGQGYAEATSLFVLGEQVYAPTVGTGCLVFDGSLWEKADCLISDIFEGTAHVHKHAHFEEAVALVPYACVTDTRLHLFDGKERWTVDFKQPVRDAVSVEGGLFVLTGLPTGEGAIFHAPALSCHCTGDFTHVVQFRAEGGGTTLQGDEPSPCHLGSAPLSLEVARGRFYVGLADGRLYQSEMMALAGQED